MYDKAAAKEPGTHSAAAKPRPSSGFYGVSANKNKWRAKLHCDGKTHCLGTFNTKQEAAAAHDKAARQHKGAGAVCNFASVEEADTVAADE